MDEQDIINPKANLITFYCEGTADTTPNKLKTTAERYDCGRNELQSMLEAATNPETFEGDKEPYVSNVA